MLAKKILNAILLASPFWFFNPLQAQSSEIDEDQFGAWYMYF
jgi:hypothetical protein